MTIPRFNPPESSGGLPRRPGDSSPPRPVTRGLHSLTDTKNGDSETVIGPFRFPQDLEIRAKFDWIRICGSGQIPQVKGVFKTWFNPQPGSNPGRGYKSVTYGDHHAALLLGRESNLENWQVEIPGTACSQLDEALRVPVIDLLKLGGHPTRLDPCIDLETEEGDLEPLLHIFQKQISIYRPGSQVIHGITPNDGRTVQMGSSKSDRYTRFYDKGAMIYREAGKWLRYETQINRARARHMGPILMESDNWSELAQGLCADASDEVKTFLPKIYDVLFCGRLIPCSIPQSPLHFERFKKYCHKSVFSTIKLLSKECDMTPLELLELLDYDEAAPSTKRSKHSGLIISIKDIAKRSEI